MNHDEEKVTRLVPMGLDVSFMRFDLSDEEAEKYEDEMEAKWQAGLESRGLVDYGGQILHFYDPKHWREVTAELRGKDYGDRDVIEGGDYYNDEVILEAISPESKQLLNELRSALEAGQIERHSGPEDALSVCDLYEAEAGGKLPSLPRVDDRHLPTVIMNWLGFEGEW